MKKKITYYSESSGAFSSHSKALLITAFSVILLLALLLGAIGLLHSNQVHRDLQTVVEQLNVKSILITRMYNAARERNLLLYAMATTRDPFARDERFLEFNDHGSRFAQARLQLIQMPLSQLERELLQQQGSITGRAVPSQREVAELAMMDRTGAAIKLLNTETVPLQNEVLSILRQLQRMQMESISHTANQVRKTNQQVNTWIIVLSIMALVIGIIIARFFIKRISDSEREVLLEKELAEVTLNSIGDGVITTDVHGRVQFMNPMAEYLTGWDLEEAKNKDLCAVFQVYDESRLRAAPNPVDVVLRNFSVMASPHNIVLGRDDDTEFAIEHTAAPIKDHQGHTHGVIVIFRDVTEMRSLSYKLTYQATHDSLTGLINRREFERRLQETIQHAHSDNAQHALCYIDLDQFKIINDAAGHAAGDELLKQLAGKLSPVLRRSDVLARLGGDEFGVVLEGCDEQTAQQIANDLLNAIRHTRFSWQNNAYEIGASIGVVPITNLTGSVSDVLSAADAACYEAKEKGRNCIHVYHQNDADVAKRRGQMRWVNSIQQAILKDEFAVYFQKIQPLFNSVQPQQYYEMLIRLEGENKHLVPPMAFIPAAERYNLMAEIDRWMVKQAIMALHDITRNDQPSKTVLSVNFSGQSLSDNQFLDFVIHEVKNAAINPSCLCFEITETTAIDNLSQVIEFIKKLKDLGCLFSLDDFGSGLCSFSYLKSMPVDFIKIDGSFIRDICNDPLDRAFVDAIHRISRLMSLKTVAEYVEQKETLKLVHSMGIDYAQGYFISHPQPLHELQQTMQKKHEIDQL